MKTVKQLQLSGLLVLLTLLSACQSKPKDGQTDTYTSGVIAIAADESFQPIVQEEIDVFEGLFPLAGIVPRYVTEVDAVNLLLKDSLRLAITSRRLTPEEMNSFNSRKFFPQEIKIATDGLALITHLGNPDSLISVKDIRRILTALDTGDYGAILRAKGIVPSGGKWLHFDYVPEEQDVRYGSADYTGRLCVIGSGLDEAGLEKLFQLV